MIEHGKERRKRMKEEGGFITSRKWISWVNTALKMTCKDAIISNNALFDKKLSRRFCIAVHVCYQKTWLSITSKFDLMAYLFVVINVIVLLLSTSLCAATGSSFTTKNICYRLSFMHRYDIMNRKTMLWIKMISWPCFLY